MGRSHCAMIARIRSSANASACHTIAPMPHLRHYLRHYLRHNLRRNPRRSLRRHLCNEDECEPC
jgi:hypothetical protein